MENKNKKEILKELSDINDSVTAETKISINSNGEETLDKTKRSVSKSNMWNHLPLCYKALCYITIINIVAILCFLVYSWK